MLVAVRVLRESHMTLAVQTSSMVVRWLACIVTSVELRLWLASFRFHYCVNLLFVYFCHCGIISLSTTTSILTGIFKLNLV